MEGIVGVVTADLEQEDASQDSRGDEQAEPDAVSGPDPVGDTL